MASNVKNSIPVPMTRLALKHCLERCSQQVVPFKQQRMNRSPLPCEPYTALTGPVLHGFIQYMQIAVLVLPGVAVLCVLAGPDGPKSCCKACRKFTPSHCAHLALVVNLAGSSQRGTLHVDRSGRGWWGRGGSGMHGMPKSDGLLGWF